MQTTILIREKSPCLNTQNIGELKDVLCIFGTNCLLISVQGWKRAYYWHKFGINLQQYSVKYQPKIVKYVRFLYFQLIAVIPLYSWIWGK